MTSRRMIEVIIYKYNEEIKKYIIAQCERYKSIKKYAFILHDKDTKEDGTSKKLHVHLLLYFGNPLPLENIVKWFEHIGVIKENLGPIHNWVSALEYLTHKNDEDKYQYNEEDITANFDFKSEIENKKRSSNVKNMIIEFSNNEITFTNLWNTLTKEEKMKYDNDISKANKIRAININLKGNRDMKVLYIYGETGIGKTTFAKQFADMMKMSYFVSGSSNDTLEGYMGQDIIIFDDLRADSFKYHDFLKLLDNHTNSLTKSRYYNKAIDCKFLIITSIKKPNELYQNRTQEDLLQLYRRIKFYIHIDAENGQVYERQLNLTATRNTGKLTLTKAQRMPYNIFDIIEKYRSGNVKAQTLTEIIKTA
jgi:energy-coupling factor transporter ATP-binding protein EcfA2